MVYKEDLLEVIGDAAHHYAKKCTDVEDATQAKEWAEAVRQLAEAYALVDTTDDDHDDDDDDEDEDE